MVITIATAALLVNALVDIKAMEVSWYNSVDCNHHSGAKLTSTVWYCSGVPP